MRSRLTLLLIISLIVLISPRHLILADTLPTVDLTLWTIENPTSWKELGIDQLFSQWAAQNAPGSTLTVVYKDLDALRADFQTSALSNSGTPDALWTVADHIIPLSSLKLIQPVDDLIDPSRFLPTIVDVTRLGGKPFGIPMYAGNHLMLYFNKDFVQQAPTTMTELINISKDLQAKNKSLDGFIPFVYNQKESFWIFPWAHALGATEFAVDGTTPNLNSDAWIKTYQFIYDLKFQEKIEPSDCDYFCAENLFLDGKAAMIINGDWALKGANSYIKKFGTKLGIAPLPRLANGNQPSPFLSGLYLILPNTIKDSNATTLKAFIRYLITDTTAITTYTVQSGRLPVIESVLESPAVTNDPVLSQTSKTLVVGVAQPTSPNIRAILDAVTAASRGIIIGQSKPEEAALAAQQFALDRIAKSQ